jgi:hypothetical protein
MGLYTSPGKKKKEPFDHLDQTLNFSKVSSYAYARDQPSYPSQ